MQFGADWHNNAFAGAAGGERGTVHAREASRSAVYSLYHNKPRVSWRVWYDLIAAGLSRFVAIDGRSVVTRWFDAGSFHHQHGGALRCSSSVFDTTGDGEALVGLQFDGPIFEVDKQLAGNNVKELVFLVVMMPMEFALDHPKPNHAVIDLTKRLGKKRCQVELFDTGSRVGQVERNNSS